MSNNYGQVWTNKLKLGDGRDLNFRQIFDEIGFDYAEIESFKENEGKIFELPQAIGLITDEFEDECVTQVKYLGRLPYYVITFSDNSEYSFSEYFRLNPYRPSKRVVQYFEARELKFSDSIEHLTAVFDNNDEVVQIIQSFTNVSYVIYDEEPDHVWQFVLESEKFLLSNGLVAYS